MITSKYLVNYGLVTNSYKDWKEELGTLPINVTQIDVV